MQFIGLYMLLLVTESLLSRCARSYNRFGSSIINSGGSINIETRKYDSIGEGELQDRRSNVILGKDMYIQNQRFWAQVFKVDETVAHKDVQKFVSKVNDEKFISLGIGLVCGKNGMRMMPIHEGKIQQQHVVDIPISSSSLSVVNAELNVENPNSGI